MQKALSIGAALAPICLFLQPAFGQDVADASTGPDASFENENETEPDGGVVETEVSLAADRFEDFDDGFEEDGDFDITDESQKSNLEKVHLHGSFENQVSGMWLNQYEGGSAVLLNDYTKVRVDLDADLPAGLKLRSDVVARLYVGQTTMSLADLIPKRTIDAAVARSPYFAAMVEGSFELENEYYIDNVYLKIPISTALVTLGKQPVEQGAGYAWNPTDVFTQKEIFDPTYDKPGVIALRLLIPIGDTASIDLLGVPDGSFETWIGGGRASLRLGPLSLSLVSYYTQAKKSDLDILVDALVQAELEGTEPPDVSTKTSANRVLLGGDAILDIEGVRLWAEGAYNFIEEKQGGPDEWWELTAGMEYFFTFETHVMGEYYHYGAGPQQQGGTYTLNDWMSLLDADLKMLGRDFLFESIDHPVADFWTLGVSSFQSFSDFSAVVMADVRWEFVQDAELWLVVLASIGDREDFLSSSRGQAWLRLKAFF